MANRPEISKPWFPLAGVAQDGYSNKDEATATCFCGAVQLAFPLTRPGLVSSFVCSCPDCRKLTASISASNFIVRDAHLKHLRGQDTLKSWSNESKTTPKGHNMTNYFCSTCGSLMYRVGEAFPRNSILRIGTVDDFNLAETVLKPRLEQFVDTRVGWLQPVEGARQVVGQAKF